ncbi:MAG: hypothetical protein HWN80_05045 [Candidatus Lokiarchaeota archaeon]|nr:hypothetical protein [Candidatus Lokiarchaeota archaeon]
MKQYRESFFITHSAWGVVKQQIAENKLFFSLSISFGELPLKSIQMASNDTIEVKQIQRCKIINSEEIILIDANLNVNDAVIKISLLKPIFLKENLKLQVELI